MLKFFRRIFVFLLVVVLVFYFSLYLFINLKGKEWVHGRFAQVFDQPVYIEDINLIIPFSLIIEGVKIGDIFQADFIKMDLQALLISGNTMVFRSVLINKPVIHILKKGLAATAPAGGVSDGGAQSIPTTSIATGKPQEKNQINILIEDLKIQQGEIIYKREVPQDGHVNDLVVKNLTLDAADFPYPFSANKISFDLSGQVESPQIPFSGRLVKAKGWIDIFSKSMDADAVVVLPSGQEGLKANVKAENNDMKVTGKVNLALLEEKVQDKPVDDYSVGDFILGALGNSGVEIEMNFAFDTKMDDLNIGKLSFSGNVLYKGQDQPGEGSSASGKEARNPPVIEVKSPGALTK